MAVEVVDQTAVEVERRALDAVPAPGIGHHVEAGLLRLEQGLRQTVGVLRMHVVVTQPVHQEQAPLEGLHVGDRRRYYADVGNGV